MPSNLRSPFCARFSFPANSSATSDYQVLNDNKGVGLMFRTEGDTLANTFKSDYGNFSGGFRKAYHHETISYNRRKDREFIKAPVAPTFGRPFRYTQLWQILTLIPDAENGLFSRFIFYFSERPVGWEQRFCQWRGRYARHHFCRIGDQFYDLYKILQTSPPFVSVSPSTGRTNSTPFSMTYRSNMPPFLDSISSLRFDAWD